ncbi:MAG: hypothetical protein ACRD23_13120 [Terriglobales bacterium]
MQSSRLRLNSVDGSPATEYRIDSGTVAVRTLTPTGIESVWRTLTPDQLSHHVERNTVVAQWLERRLGWRRLLRACVGQELWSDCKRYESVDSGGHAA